MLEMMDIGIEKAVAYRLGGKITEDEMTLVLSALKVKIEQHGEVFIYQEVESIGGAEFDAIIEKFKFFADVGISKLSRIAVITHKKWMHKIIDLEGKLFKKITIKAFAIGDKDAAIAFLKSK